MPAFLIPVEQGRPVPLDKAVVLFGRNSDCDVVLSRSRKISRKHCCIAQVNNRLVIRDLGSLNGVWINGKRVRRQAFLRLGDKVAVGDVQYILQDERAVPQSKSTCKDAQRQPIQVPAVPADLSQEVPVPLPDEADGYRVDPALQETPEAFPSGEISL